MEVCKVVSDLTKKRTSLACLKKNLRCCRNNNFTNNQTIMFLAVIYMSSFSSTFTIYFTISFAPVQSHFAGFTVRTFPDADIDKAFDRGFICEFFFNKRVLFSHKLWMIFVSVPCRHMKTDNASPSDSSKFSQL